MPQSHEKKQRESSARHWCVTTFVTKNYRYWKTLDLADKGVRNITYQLEQCPKSNKLHVQAYVEFFEKVRMAVVKQRLEDTTLHCEKRRGTRLQAREYCMKDETRVIATQYVCLGLFQTKQGDRTDITQLKDFIETNATEADVAEAFPCAYLKMSTGIRRLINVRRRKLLNVYSKVDVHVLWGDTGAGKTRSVFDEYGPENVFVPVYSASAGKFWFDGYAGQKVLLINEFYGQVRCGYMLELLDDYHKTLEVKGDTCISSWDTVYLSSNCHPDEWYTNWTSVPTSKKHAFARRINTVTHLEKKQLAVVVNFSSKPEHKTIGKALVLPLPTSGPGPKRSAGLARKCEPKANGESKTNPAFGIFYKFKDATPLWTQEWEKNREERTLSQEK